MNDECTIIIITRRPTTRGVAGAFRASHRCAPAISTDIGSVIRRADTTRRDVYSMTHENVVCACVQSMYQWCVLKYVYDLISNGGSVIESEYI